MKKTSFFKAILGIVALSISSSVYGQGIAPNSNGPVPRTEIHEDGSISEHYYFSYDGGVVDTGYQIRGGDEITISFDDPVMYKMNIDVEPGPTIRISVGQYVHADFWNSGVSCVVEIHNPNPDIPDLKFFVTQTPW